MMNPAQIQFESQNDVIDYVTKGLPPRKKDFQSLMDAIEHRSPDDASVDKENPGSRVIIRQGIEFDMDDDALVNALNHIYKNRVHNRNILIGAGVVIGALVFMGGMKQHNRIKELESECDHLKEDLPVVEVTPL